MRRSKVMVLATCLGSFILVVFYFQSSLSSGFFLSSSQHYHKERMDGNVSSMDKPMRCVELHQRNITTRTLPYIGLTHSGGKPPLDMAEDHFTLGNWNGKPRRSPLHALYDSDQFEPSSIQAKHQTRRELLASACKTYTRKRRVLTADDLKHLIVDDTHGLLYCYVPKVACTNWKRVMMVLTGKGKYKDPTLIPANEAHIPSNLRTLSEFSTSEINYRLRNYLKFIFVREPFERLVSAYRNKFTRTYNTAFHKRYGTKIIERHRRDPSLEALERGDDVTFEEFLYYLVDPQTQKEEPFNEHWERVHSLCHPCIVQYDVVGKYETLEEDANYLLQLVGVGDSIKFPSSKTTRTTDGMAAGFFKGINHFYQRRLFNLFKMDFLLFNYSIPHYLQIR